MAGPADPKRDGVRASMTPWTEPPMEFVEDRWYGPLGAFLEVEGMAEGRWLLCCPGCGQVGAPRQGAQWRVTDGGFDNVRGLTLEPSIQMACCGWHGYLRNGVFVI